MRNQYPFPSSPQSFISRLFRAEWAFSFHVKSCVSVVFPAVLCLFLRRMGAVMRSVLYNMRDVYMFPFRTVLLSCFPVPDLCSLPSFPCRRYERRRRLSCSLLLLYIRRDILLNMIKGRLHTVQQALGGRLSVLFYKKEGFSVPVQ